MIALLLSPLVATGNPWWEVFGRLHPLLLHFPIALIVLGALWAAVLRLLGGRDLTSSVVTFCLWGGLVGASLAAWAGWTLADYQQEVGNLVDLHRWFSVSVVVTMVLAAVFDLLRRSERWPWAAGARLMALLVSAVLVSIAGHFGAEMKWGVGWVLAPLESVAATTQQPPVAEAASSTDAVPGATPAANAEDGDNADSGQDASEAAPQIGAAPIDPVAGEAPTGVVWAQVEPLFEAHCARCHGPDRQKAGLQLVPYTALFPADPALWVVTPSQPQSSELFRRISLPMDDVDVMPPDDDAMSPQAQELIEAWIAAGAPGPEGHGPSIPETPSDDSADSVEEASTPVSPDSGERADPAAVLPQGMDAAAARVAIDALRGRGITVRPLHKGSPWLAVSFARVDPVVGDGDLQPLAALAAVVWSIDASRSGLTDAGMGAIASCVQLRTLRLDHTAVGAAGVALLSDLSHLEVLNLFGTPVNDAALATIEGLVALKAVYLGNTAVTASGLQQLRSGREDLAVHGNASLPAPEVEEEKGEQDEEPAKDKEDEA